MKKLFTKKSIISGTFIGALLLMVISPAILANYGDSAKDTTWISDADVNFRVSGSTTVFPIISATLSSTTANLQLTVGNSLALDFTNNINEYVGVVTITLKRI